MALYRIGGCRVGLHSAECIPMALYRKGERRV